MADLKLKQTTLLKNLRETSVLKEEFKRQEQEKIKLKEER